MKLKNIISFVTLIIIFTLVSRYFLGEYIYQSENVIPSQEANAEDHIIHSSEKTKNDFLKSLNFDNGNAIFYELDPIFVNLPSSNKRSGERSIDITLIIQLKDRKFEKDLESHKHLIRDKILNTLSLREPIQLLDLSNRSDIEKELSLVLNSIFEPDLVQLFISSHLDSFKNPSNITKLQNLRILPYDSTLKHNSIPDSLSKNLSNDSFPIRSVLFKDVRIN